MFVGCPKEIKAEEYRVGLTPSCVREYVVCGHTVLVETDAGVGSGFLDQDYLDAGAEVIENAKELYARSEMIVKVKEPLPSEYDYLREGQIIYAYLHFASDEGLTRAMLEKRITTVAYETMEGPNRSLPCLKPMSEIAGRLSVMEGAKHLGKHFGGSGILISGVTGVAPAKVLVLGAGVVGTNACKMAVGMGASVTVMDVNNSRLEYLDDIFAGRVTTIYSSAHNIEVVLREADIVIGSVLIPGSKTPKLVRREHLAMMKKGTVMVDVAVDQGGCFETSRQTTHSHPTFELDGIIHYCVSNMPGAVPRTATIALTNATMVHGVTIANFGVKAAARANKLIATGLNTYDGKVTYQGVADAFGLPYHPVLTVIGEA